MAENKTKPTDVRVEDFLALVASLAWLQHAVMDQRGMPV